MYFDNVDANLKAKFNINIHKLLTTYFVKNDNVLAMQRHVVQLSTEK